MDKILRNEYLNTFNIFKVILDMFCFGFSFKKYVQCTLYKIQNINKYIFIINYCKNEYLHFKNKKKRICNICIYYFYVKNKCKKYTIQNVSNSLSIRVSILVCNVYLSYNDIA